MWHRRRAQPQSRAGTWQQSTRQHGQQRPRAGGGQGGVGGRAVGCGSAGAQVCCSQLWCSWVRRAGGRAKEPGWGLRGTRTGAGHVVAPQLPQVCCDLWLFHRLLWPRLSSRPSLPLLSSHLPSANSSVCFSFSSPCFCPFLCDFLYDPGILWELFLSSLYLPDCSCRICPEKQQAGLGRKQLLRVFSSLSPLQWLYA